MRVLCHNSGLHKYRPGGEIGRRRGLKIPLRKECRFDSGPGHHRQSRTVFNDCAAFLFGVQFAQYAPLVRGSVGIGSLAHCPLKERIYGTA